MDLSFAMKLVLVIICGVVCSLPCRLEALDDLELYLSGYGVASQPSNKGVSFQARGITKETINGGPGLGLKIGFFPHVIHGYGGIELEWFGNKNSISFPVVRGSKTVKGNSRLITYQSMVNLILRYPGPWFRPYVGIGGGYSNGILVDADFPNRNDKSWDTAIALSYQFLGGMQFIISKGWFVFGEYKYFSANYHWKRLSLEFRSEYVLGGIGFLF